MKPSQRTIYTLVVAVCMVLAALVTSLWAFHEIDQATAVQKQSNVLLQTANDLMSELKDAETSQRGYLLTGDEAFLKTYASLARSIPEHFKKLQALTYISAAQERLNAVEPLIQEKMVAMKAAIESRRSEKNKVISIGRGKQLMDSIRIEMAAFDEIQQAALVKRTEHLAQTLRRLLFVTITIATLTLLFALFCVYMLYQKTQQRLKNLVHVETSRLLAERELTNQQLESANLVLIESEGKLAVTLDSIGDAVIATDANALITMMNQVAEQLTGWTLGQAKGRAIDEVFHIIHRESREPSTIPVAAALEKGTIHGLANHTVLIARDGTEYDIGDSCAPIRDRSGHVIGAVLVFRDVTEEYAVRQALLDSAELVQAVMNNVADGVVTLNARGGLIEKVNPAVVYMFGYRAPELMGKSFDLLVPELDQDKFEGSLGYYKASIAQDASGVGREVIGLHKNGSSIPLEITMSEMRLGGQRFFTAILRDITSRKRTQVERALADQVLDEKNIELERAILVADKANMAKSDFLSSMSHELRTPLAAILGFSQLIDSSNPAPTPSQKRSNDQILQAGWFLLDLINEILDLALIESGKLSLSLEPISLLKVLHECQEMIEPQAEKRHIDITFPHFEQPYFINADRTRIKQVLINLLSNAIKYNKIGGSVVLKVDTSTVGRVRLCVEDSGNGLPPGKLLHLFEPFNRLGQEAGSEQGTGIGLVVCKRLIELMSGTIGVESTVGKGSTFWIELNLVAEPEREDYASNITTSAALASSDGTVKTLLYVEDNPANLMLVEDIIARRSNIRLLTARDGNKGVAVARTTLPDVILMDINLPGISGLMAMRILAEDPNTTHIPVIALSANAMPRDIEKGLEAGFFRYLTKPIKVIEFMDTLDEALAFAQTQSVPSTKLV
jgi:PAS domain S-box-containing protein